MKKLMILLLCVIGIQSTIKADNDTPITFEQLPKQSQQFINKYFTNQQIALVKMESDFFDKSYEIIFTNGNKVDFDKKGEWKDIDCRYSELPAETVPAQIRSFVTQNYPNVKITIIEKKSKQGYEVGLSNGLDLKFNSKFKLIEIDD